MSALQTKAAAALARAYGREKTARSINERTALPCRAVGWLAIGAALFVVLGVDDPRPVAGSLSTEWGNAPRSTR